MISYVSCLVGSNRDAEDLIQIAFLQLFDQLTAGIEINNLRAWLYRVAHNLAIEHSKQRDRRTSLIRTWFADQETTAFESAEEVLIRRERIERSLMLLNERERHALRVKIVLSLIGRGQLKTPCRAQLFCSPANSPLLKKAKPVLAPMFLICLVALLWPTRKKEGRGARCVLKLLISPAIDKLLLHP